MVMSKELEDAINAANSEPIQGAPFKYYDVDYLEVEVLKLPIVGLSMDFLWRFSKPFEGILNVDPIKLSHSMTQINNKTYEERLKDAVLAEWKKMVSSEDDIDDPKAKAMIQKWNNISEVRVHYMKLVRDEE